MRKHLTLAVTFYSLGLWLASTTPAFSQGAALVNPTPTSGHCAQWTNSNTIGDAGAACGSGGGGSGTVTSVGSGTGLLGGPITTSGSLSVNTGVIAALANSNTWPSTQTFSVPIVAPNFTSTVQGLVPLSGGGTSKFLRADGTWQTVTGTGTVTSITAGNGLTGGTITSTGTLAIDLTKTFNQTTNGLVPAPITTSGRFLGDDFAWHVANGSGTVTSIATTGALGGGTCTTTCNLFLGANVMLTDTFNGVTANSLANSAATYMAFLPTDYGVGKPQLSIGKNNASTPQEWDLSCYDGVSFTCKINISASNFTWNGNPVSITGSSSSLSNATIYDVVAGFAGSGGGAIDNSTPFTNAKNACSAGGGGIILFRAGNFRFNSPIDNNAAGCQIVGYGPQTTNLIYYGATGNFLTVDAYNSGVSGLAILNGGSWTSGFGLAVGVNAGASLATYNNLYFSGIPGFIYVTGSTETKFTNIYGVNPTGATAYQCDGAGFSGVFGSRWSNVQVGYQSTNTTTNSFHMGSGCNSWALSQAGSSGAIGGSGNDCLLMDAGAAFLFIDDLECDHSVAGAVINGGTGIQISNGWFGSTLSGAGLSFTSGFSGFASIGTSHIRDNSSYGVSIAGSGGITLVNNVISGNASGGVVVAGGVGHFTIGNNELGLTSDPTQAFCVGVNTGASNYYTITNNVCEAGNTLGVVDNGSGGKKSVTGNVGP